MTRSTVFSPCRRYRYTLWREWGDLGQSSLFQQNGTIGQPHEYVQFIGLNPSTADEVHDDPTVRRCIQFAKDWGFGALCMTNAFAWRDTDPEKMKKAEFNPQGEALLHDYGRLPDKNLQWLLDISEHAGLVVAAWGKDGAFCDRSNEILELFRKFDISLHCLGLNGDGTPKHPLYLSSKTKPIPYL